MTRLQRLTLAIATVLTAGACAPATQGTTASPRMGGDIDFMPAASTVIADWPETPREVAETIIDRYGEPDEVTPSRLIWFNNGPWKRTIVYRDTVPHNFPVPHSDLLEQVIDYRLPPEMFDAIAEYDGSVIVERTKGEMAARCDKELANFLAINLAHDVATGRRSVDEARSFYAETIQAVMRGESPAYTQRFQFELPRGDTRDPDRPASGMGSRGMGSRM